MHIFTNRRDNEWFPTIGVTFDRTSDLIFTFLAITMALTIIALLVLSGTRLLRYAIQLIAKLTAGAIVHIGVLVIEIGLYTYNIISIIPLSWYILTGVAIVPMTLDISRPVMVWFLLAYCIPNAWISLHCITAPKVNRQKQDHRQTHTPPMNPPAAQVHSQLFTGLRIGE